MSRTQTVWLSPEEFSGESLPSLLNSSSRRKKTLDSLFVHLRGQIYRCKEFPHGVYIDDFGQVCPDHPNSGIYQCSIDETEDADNLETEDEDNDNHVDTEDVYWKEEEDRVSSKKRKRTSQDEGVLEAKSSSDDEDSKEEQEEEDSDFEPNSTDEEWQPVRKTKKARKNAEITSDSEEEDTHSSNDEKEDEEEESETEDEVMLEEDIKSATEDMERFHSIDLARRKQRLKTQKLIAFVETLTDDWAEVRRKRHADTKRLANNSRIKNTTIQMEFDSALQGSEPSCTFTFRKPGHPHVVTAALDSEKVCLVCSCNGEAGFDNANDVYTHVEAHFAPHSIVSEMQ